MLSRNQTRYVVVVTVFLLLISLWSYSVTESSYVHASEVIRVPKDYPTIQDAIDAANAGDTVEVAGGTYYENLLIDKTITLIGAGKTITILDGNLSDVIVVSAANNVVITGFTIRNGADGVFFDKSNKSRVSDNDVINCLFDAVGFRLSSNNTVTNNIFRNNQIGVDVYDNAADNTVNDNTIALSKEDGVSLYFSSSNTIRNNTISGNNTGVSLSSSNANILTDNTILGHEYAGVELYESSDNVFCHNNFINNLDQVLPWSKNSWNNTNTGNHWSNYNGADANGDGVGDTPFTIDTSNVDYFPLMNPYDKTKPKANAGPDRLILNGTNVTFNGNASTDNMGIKDYVWTFTDVTLQALHGVEAGCQFNNVGNFSVTLNVSDFSGNWDTDSMWVNATETLVFRDIAITDITAAPNTVTMGEVVSISVTVYNKGNFTEAFTVKVFYDSNFIKTRNVTSLSSQSHDTLTFNWNTTDVPGKEYTVEAVASPVPAEANITDNTMQFGGKVAVLRAPSKLSIFVVPANITIGESATISGLVSPVARGANISIGYRLADGIWDRLQEVSTDTSGRYGFGWTPATVGTYQIKASWSGNAFYLSQESSVETLAVNERLTVNSWQNILLFTIVGAFVLIAIGAVGFYFLRRRREIVKPPPEEKRSLVRVIV